MTEYQIHLRGSDGKNYLMTFAQAKQELGICRLESKVRELEKPIRKKEIVRLLKESDRPRTWMYFSRRVYEFRMNDLRELVDEGTVVKTRSGSHVLYGFSDRYFEESIRKHRERIEAITGEKGRMFK